MFIVIGAMAVVIVGIVTWITLDMARQDKADAREQEEARRAHAARYAE